MRITGGNARGIHLIAPKGNTIRPATDFMRQAVFSSLGPIIENATFLDLFAGSGAYGLEALSRGASSGTFVELSAIAIPIIKQNLKAVAKSLQIAPTTCHILQTNVFKNPINTTFDLIFADPPYELFSAILSSLLNLIPTWLTQNENARFILEAPGQLSTPHFQKLSLVKRLGKSSKNSPSALIFKLSDLAED